MQEVKKEVADGQSYLYEDIEKLMETVEQIFHLLKDLRYKVTFTLCFSSALNKIFIKDGSETVESAFDAFLDMSSPRQIKEFESYAFELKKLFESHEAHQDFGLSENCLQDRGCLNDLSSAGLCPPGLS